MLTILFHPVKEKLLQMEDDPACIDKYIITLPYSRYKMQLRKWDITFDIFFQEYGKNRD